MSYRPLSCVVLAMCITAITSTWATEMPVFNVEHDCAKSDTGVKKGGYPPSLCVRIENQSYAIVYEAWGETKDVDRRVCADLAAKQFTYRYQTLRRCLENFSPVRKYGGL